MSWEDELDDEKEDTKKNEPKKNILSKFNDESEEIIVTKTAKNETIRQKDKPRL